MGEVTEDRFCPICEQIVPREVLGIRIKVSPSRTFIIHEGCGRLVSSAYDAETIVTKEELEELEI